MNRIQFLGLMLLASLSSLGVAAEKAPLCFELRTYYAAEGKLDALNTRFKDHTTALFTRHGMMNVGYWMPLENPERKLIYLLSYPDLAARETSWKAFQADPEWVGAKAASEVSGKLVDRVDSRFLTLTDFSPAMKVDPAGAPHTFEMRTYTATPGNLPRLLDRFRQYTVGLFSKHGMKHFGYFTPSAGQPGAEDTLIYFLYHASPEAHDASFAAFGTDLDWIKVRVESETAAGGSLTVPAGVKSVMLKATDFSPVK
ncbi:MAG: NIPSNAP family protein [Verrucomicrobiota bacterium]